jgi:hypothetical protein
MKKIVITIQDDVCVKNGRDPEATALIEAAKSFGKVESWDSAILAEKTQYQASLDNIRKNLESIKDFGVTEAELEVLKVLRKKSAAEAAAFEKTIADRDAQLNAIKVESENRVAQIRAIYGI